MPAIRRLKSQEDCRRAIAWVFRQVEANAIDPPKGRVLIYAALSISSILTDHDFEARMKALEERQSQPVGFGMTA